MIGSPRIDDFGRRFSYCVREKLWYRRKHFNLLKHERNGGLPGPIFLRLLNEMNAFQNAFSETKNRICTMYHAK